MRMPNIVGAQYVNVVDLKRPWRRIAHEPCLIVVGKRFTWAEDCRGKRHLLGASAFYTRKGATLKKRMALEEGAMNPFPLFIHGGRRWRCIEELRAIAKGAEL